jgi:folate-binding protein YgfZ
MNDSWIEYLRGQGATFEDGAIRFPSGPAAPGAQLVPLTHLAIVRARGEEAAGFLHNLFSNDVKQLAVDKAQWNSFNSPKGRMLANFLLWRRDGDYLLAMAADVHPAMLKKLSMYVLRSKVKLSDAQSELALIGITGPGAGELLIRVGLAIGESAIDCAAADGAQVICLAPDSYVVAVEAGDAAPLHARLLEAGAAAAGTEAWQAAMISAGLPLVTAPVQDEFVAQMLNYELIGGVSFSKGCYPGQEIVARTQYLGKLKKRMYRVRIGGGDAPQVGADLFAPDFGEQAVGKLVNVVAAGDGFEALAVMQSSSAEGGEVHLASIAGPRVEFLALPYSLA